MGDDLRELAERLRGLQGISRTIAEEARPDVEAAARATAAAGTDPYGTAWEPKKAGERPLANAAGAIRAVVSGASRAVVTLIIGVPHMWHQFGTRRDPQRQILPDTSKGDLPAPLRAAVQAAARRVVGEQLGGG